MQYPYSPSATHVFQIPGLSDKYGPQAGFPGPINRVAILVQLQKRYSVLDIGALVKIYEGINPFPCRDTQRVHRIAYEREDMGLYDQAIRSALQNFGELQEVLLIEWNRNVIDFYRPWLKSNEKYFPTLFHRHSYDTRNLCKFTEIQKN
ncbi:hypothetical protein DER46DRAFT_597479 [Fusarium sp. MPI-SDFR-AT-0072]|nr:hypothetical protein DER46DRAFT_597479 [Fusarium sp. MPI-SDFR-AT-0072]